MLLHLLVFSYSLFLLFACTPAVLGSEEPKEEVVSMRDDVEEDDTVRNMITVDQKDINGLDPMEYFCVDDGNVGFECSNDPMEVRDRTDRDRLFLPKLEIVSRGVAQRIDGNEQEQNAIRKVLQRMEDYLDQEVLAKPEYEIARAHW